MGERMTINLDEITRALAEATPGPWLDYCILNVSTGGGEHRVNNPHLGVDVARCGSSVPYSRQDAHLIAHAPEWLRLLVERVRKQDAAIASVSEYLTKLASLKHDYVNNVPAVSEKIGRNMDESAGYWKGALDITEYYAKESLRLFDDKESV